MSSQALHSPGNLELNTATPLRTPQRQSFTASLDTTSPPSTDMATIMQRADEVNALQRILSEATTRVVTLTGYPGAGKATLAALLYQRWQLAAQAAMPAPKHLVWLRIRTI